MAFKYYVSIILVIALLCVCGCSARDKDSNTDTIDSSAAETTVESAGSSTEDASSADESSITAPADSFANDSVIDDGKVTYTVKLVDGDNAPMAGVLVQICNDQNCFPALTDANGIATLLLDEGDYKACVSGTEEYTYFESGATEVTLVYTAE